VQRRIIEDVVDPVRGGPGFEPGSWSLGGWSGETASGLQCHPLTHSQALHGPSEDGVTRSSACQPKLPAGALRPRQPEEHEHVEASASGLAPE
jgi:hypothetical protein